MTPTSLPERDLARRLLSREASGSDDPATWVAAGERVFVRLHAQLAYWFGADGLEALLGRAMDRAGVPQRATGEPATPPRRESAVDVIAATTRSMPSREGADAVEMILTAFIELLGRVVGPDMAERLVGQSQPRPTGPEQGRSAS